MPYFSKKSKDRLETCSASIQIIMNDAIKYIDFSVLCGYRGESKQNKAFNEGKSKLKWPHSKHNLFPSRAIDIAPWPINWQDINRFYELSGYIQHTAQLKNINLFWGGHWVFKDFPHYEIKEKL